MLIGLDNGHLIEPLESRHGSSGDTYAFRTQLGWVCRGRMNKDSTAGVGLVNFNRLEKSEETRMEDVINKFFENESYGAESQDGK